MRDQFRLLNVERVLLSPSPSLWMQCVRRLFIAAVLLPGHFFRSDARVSLFDPVGQFSPSTLGYCWMATTALPGNGQGIDHQLEAMMMMVMTMMMMMVMMVM